MTVKELTKKIEGMRANSAWKKGVKEYALEIVESGLNWRDDDELVDIMQSRRLLEKALLNGADDWHAYSWGGCSLIYDGDIAERLCNPSELKRKRGGALPPNSRERWLDVQVRALYQARYLVKRLATE